MKILMSGGGSMGSVSPLLAIQNYIQEKHSNQNPDFFWLISRKGPEAGVLNEKNIRFKRIISARLKRGFNPTIIWQLIKLGLAFWQSLFILIKYRPNIILSSGSYTSPPVIWTGWFLRIPSLIHQQDLKPGLANKMMAPFAKKITVCFAQTKKYFNFDKTSVVGNPVRREVKKVSQLSQQAVGERIKQAREYFKLEDNLPVLLVVSGSQGAIIINEVTLQALPELLKFCQVIHITGKRKINSQLLTHFVESRRTINHQSRYHRFEFLTDKMIDALLVADLIVSRAGINFLTEMSYVKKASLLIPVYNSHQEDNAKYFEAKNAAEMLSLKDKGGDIKKQTQQFIERVQKLIADQIKLKEYAENISQIILRNSEKEIVEKINQILR